ncbi:MAG: glycosyltransferase family 2 protein [Sandaracinaceae bacterium]|nr:glycosyltransferase family 2 protein [Sandaracinaceae bacterium]
MEPIELSIVILSWNTLELTRACLRSLREDTTRHAREVIVIDNASHDGSAEMIESEFPEVRLVVNPENRLYAAANNQGARRSRGRLLCLMNSDIEVRPGALDRLVDFLDAHPDYGAVSPKLLNPDGTVQPACCRFPTLADPVADSTFAGGFPPGSWFIARRAMADFDHLTSRDVDQPPAACFLMRREEYLSMGGFDEELSLYFNDVDLCLRLWQRGRRIRFLAEAEVFHLGGASTRALRNRAVNLLWLRNRESFFAKHYPRVGKPWLRTVLALHGTELLARISLGPRPSAQARAAQREVLAQLRECVAPATDPGWSDPDTVPETGGHPPSRAAGPSERGDA